MPEFQQDELYKLISDIYDCALEPDNWPIALANITRFMGGAYCSINLVSVPLQNPALSAHSPFNEEVLRDLYANHAADIPGLGDLAQGPLDMPSTSYEPGGFEAFSKTRFYREWAEPNGLSDATLCKIAQTGDRVGVFAAVMPQSHGFITERDHWIVRSIAPHLRRAVMIGDLLDRQQQLVQGYARLVDAVPTPLILTDRYAKVLQINQAADFVLAQGRTLAIHHGILTAGTQAKVRPIHGLLAYKSLSEAIERAAQDDVALGQRGIGIALEAPGESPVVAYVLPLQASPIRSAFHSGAVAVFLSTREHSRPVMGSLLATLFDLTPAEARIVPEVVRGAGAKEIANKLGVSENTVISHLKRVYQKTGTNKQTQLAALVHGIELPYADLDRLPGKQH
jgi:DNA-binding CsgD family transcriptional regulator